MRIIVTGASGFIGKNFLLKAPKNWEIIALFYKNRDFLDFLKQHHLRNVKALQCNLTKKNDVQRVFKKTKNPWDICLYLAAKVDLPESIKNPTKDLQVNTIGLLNFLDRFQGKRFVFMSSGAVYEKLKGYVHPRSPLGPTLPYAISKMASEQYVKFYQERKKTIKEYINIRFYGAYGPYEPSHKIYTKMLKTFCLENKNEFTIRGDGKNFINAMYVDDAIAGLMKICVDKPKNLTVDFVGPKPFTIKDLIKKTARILRVKNLKIITTGTTAEYISFYSINRKLKYLYNFSPSIPLEKGILKFKNFFVKKHAKK